VSLRAGSVVVLHLAQPREQVFGVVLSLGVAGILVRGISVGSVDDWLRHAGREVASEEGESSGGHLALSQTFYPMHRVEKIALDEPSHGIPSVRERFLDRVGLDLIDFVLEHHGDALESG
jgi:hypothetical protein